MESMDFHGTHGISWNPRIIHGFHEVFMESTKLSWNPRTFNGLHEVFMESTKFPWAPRNFHEVRGIHGKANWIVTLKKQEKQGLQLKRKSPLRNFSPQ